MATIRYVTYGSEAYDYSRSREIYADTPATERNTYRQKTERREKTRTRQAAKRNSLSTFFSVACIVLSVGMIVLNLLSYAMLTEISEATTAAEEQYIQLQEEKAKLLVKYEQTFNMNDVENYAINTMGMVRPTSGQTVELGSLKSDKAVVYSYETEKDGNIFTDMANLVSSLLAYFGR